MCNQTKEYIHKPKLRKEIIRVKVNEYKEYSLPEERTHEEQQTNGITRRTHRIGIIGDNIGLEGGMAVHGDPVRRHFGDVRRRR